MKQNALPQWLRGEVLAKFANMSKLWNAACLNERVTESLTDSFKMPGKSQENLSDISPNAQL